MTFSERIDWFCGASERYPVILPPLIYEQVCRYVLSRHPELWDDPDLPPFLKKGKTSC